MGRINASHTGSIAYDCSTQRSTDQNCQPACSQGGATGIEGAAGLTTSGNPAMGPTGCPQQDVCTKSGTMAYCKTLSSCSDFNDNLGERSEGSFGYYYGCQLAWWIAGINCHWKGTSCSEKSRPDILGCSACTEAFKVYQESMKNWWRSSDPTDERGWANRVYNEIVTAAQSDRTRSRFSGLSIGIISADKKAPTVAGMATRYAIIIWPTSGSGYENEGLVLPTASSMTGQFKDNMFTGAMHHSMWTSPDTLASNIQVNPQTPLPPPGQ